MIGTTMDDAPLGLDPIDLDEGLTRDGLTGLPGLEMAREKLAEWVKNGGPAPDEPVPATRVHALLLGLRRLRRSIWPMDRRRAMALWSRWRGG
jgi:hypothetical protein